ncbi:hypothetical protein KP509_06G081300 [Ceratopteris richardii]|uniref:FLZ-type domain-containing protein n=1 Tax=Ceratopteris richardii TaxID=49495 RepID=A0A8T2UMR9_CERRI|nr:hypothetical protein KP509_06G081300 [Ceratopteris richardii]KAH7435840.1 hypothetical protein KP509_06G081300 [Ceratopteris richardii]
MRAHTAMCRLCPVRSFAQKAAYQRIWSIRIIERHSAGFMGLAAVAAIQTEVTTDPVAIWCDLSPPLEQSHPPESGPIDFNITSTRPVQLRSTHLKTRGSSLSRLPIPLHAGEGVSITRSIFSLSSPAEDPPACAPIISSEGSCFLCRRPFLPSKDIYMYRCQAFCTRDCRHHQIVKHEQEEKMKLSADRGPQSPHFQTNACSVSSSLRRRKERRMCSSG